MTVSGKKAKPIVVGTFQDTFHQAEAEVLRARYEKAGRQGRVVIP